MKFNKNISYSCVLCGCTTNTLHEIFYNTANRKISIEYNLQTPLCNKCHIKVHMKKKMWQFGLCLKLEIDYNMTKRRINNFKENKEYFEGIKDKCLEKIKSWEV